jgi:hypothetical protein
MIPEKDIWRAAILMLRRYGDKALEETATRAGTLTSASRQGRAGGCHRAHCSQKVAMLGKPARGSSPPASGAFDLRCARWPCQRQRRVEERRFFAPVSKNRVKGFQRALFQFDILVLIAD